MNGADDSLIPHRDLHHAGCYWLQAGRSCREATILRGNRRLGIEIGSAFYTEGWLYRTCDALPVWFVFPRSSGGHHTNALETLIVSCSVSSRKPSC